MKNFYAYNYYKHDMNTQVPRNTNDGAYDHWLILWDIQHGTHDSLDDTLPSDEHPRPSAPSPTFTDDTLANYDPFAPPSPYSPLSPIYGSDSPSLLSPYQPQPYEVDFDSTKLGPELGTEDCPICLDTISKDQVTTHCKHTFHRACLEQNIAHSHSTLCPICRHQFELK